MNTVSVSPFIDRYHPQKDGKCLVSIRVTSQRKKRYYRTEISLKPADFDRILVAKRRTELEKDIYKDIQAFINKAYKVIDTLPVFTFPQFELLYFENRDATNSLSLGFESYIKELKQEKRIGTAVSFETAKNSFEAFQKGVKFADITKSFLTQYENHLIEASKSKTTVGIYIRSLRVIFNRQNIDKALYPFGSGKNKYSIPTGRNIKKALSLEEISRIFCYQAEQGTNEDLAKDYWIFIYLCNGLNMKDLCLLKRKNVTDQILTYERAKTQRSKKQGEKIIVSLKPEAKTIIAKWGVRSISPDSFIFPHLQQGMTAETERKTIQQLTKVVNKYMCRIARTLGITKTVTTYFARHSFATVLKRSGASTEFISEALGHSDLKTTKNYLAGFEEATIHRTTDALTAFTNKAS